MTMKMTDLWMMTLSTITTMISPADDLDDNIPLGDALGSNEFTAT